MFYLNSFSLTDLSKWSWLSSRGRTKQTVESRLSFCGRSEKFLNVVITRLVQHLQAARDKWNAALYEEDDDEEGEDVETDCSSFRPSASKKKKHPFEIPLAFKKTPLSNEDQLAGGSSWCSAFEIHCAIKRGRCFFCDADSSQTEVGHLEGRNLEHSQDLSEFWMYTRVFLKRKHAVFKKSMARFCLFFDFWRDFASSKLTWQVPEVSTLCQCLNCFLFFI